jgi:hypothetical protein
VKARFDSARKMERRGAVAQRQAQFIQERIGGRRRATKADIADMVAAKTKSPA